MRDGHKLTFPDKGNREPGLQTGDIIIILKEKPDAKFKRIENDLYYRMSLSVKEALCGFEKVLKTLDDRSLVVSRPPGATTKPDSFKAIRNEGMPLSCFAKGKLFVQFRVKFPKEMDQRTCTELKYVLPPDPECIVPDDAEHVSLLDEKPPEFAETREHRIPCPVQ